MMENLTTEKATLKAGDKVPAFEGVDQDGKVFSSASLKGYKYVMFFYPKDNTPGCIAEACNLRDNYSLLKKNGYAIIGISADGEKAHKRFISKYSLPFPLLADTDKSIINAFGVWGEKKLFGITYNGILRTTFVINEKGIIEKVINKVDTKITQARLLICKQLETTIS